jgi:hypothetical protein
MCSDVEITKGEQVAMRPAIKTGGSRWPHEYDHEYCRSGAGELILLAARLAGGMGGVYC